MNHTMIFFDPKLGTRESDDAPPTDPDERIRRAMLRILAPKPSLQRWTTRDGRRVRICEMSDRHLMNLIALIELQKRRPGSQRATAEKLGLIPVLLDERKRRGLEPESEAEPESCAAYMRGTDEPEAPWIEELPVDPKFEDPEPII